MNLKTTQPETKLQRNQGRIDTIPQDDQQQIPPAQLGIENVAGNCSGSQFLIPDLLT
ncbi:MAG: hypothetical protein GY702_08240 [Desulfobulbaceae bacterium]|nr:hypothetical protein [Desulfobulbaceae bacterium]